MTNASPLTTNEKPTPDDPNRTSINIGQSKQRARRWVKKNCARGFYISAGTLSHGPTMTIRETSSCLHVFSKYASRLLPTYGAAAAESNCGKAHEAESNRAAYTKFAQTLGFPHI
ncbi:hypothetical protein Mapa_008506 [Marchantia paleacea]|nr:hypothetical protein Mapa_008506 [Marchantia paleacea]